MSNTPYMPVFVGDLIKDTPGLSAEEFGAYCLLLFATWANRGQPFADDDARLARICRVTTKRWRERLRPALVGFFDLSGGTWRQKRLEKEWIFVAKQVEQKRRAGKASHEAKLLRKQETLSTAVAEPLPTASQQRSNNSHSHPALEVDGSSTESHEPREESSNAPEPARGGGSALYAFAGKVIRLTKADLEEWRRAYHAIPDIEAALHSMDIWYAKNMKEAEKKDWFWRCSTALGKKHQEYTAAARNVEKRGQSNNYNLYEGFYNAGQEFDGRDGDSGVNSKVVIPLLDRRRYAGDAEGAGDGLDRGSDRVRPALCR